MNWFFWSIPLVAQLMIGVFFILEGLSSIRQFKEKTFFWPYLEVLSGILLAIGFFSTAAVLILIYINNRYYLIPANQTQIKLMRLLMVNGVLILLFDPHWINSLILHYERIYFNSDQFI